MKSLWAFALFFAVLTGWSQINDGRLQLQLLPGQVLKLELSSGNYRIEPGVSDKIVVISKSQSQQQKPRFGIDTNSQEASVRVEAPKDYTAVIQVPRNSTLKVRLTGGSLSIAGIEGDKDIESSAGDVSIDVGQPENYNRVDASVDIGLIDAPPFQVAQNGAERSFIRRGPGSYHLHAHVGTGEIRMYSGEL